MLQAVSKRRPRKILVQKVTFPKWTCTIELMTLQTSREIQTLPKRQWHQKQSDQLTPSLILRSSNKTQFMDLKKSPTTMLWKDSWPLQFKSRELTKPLYLQPMLAEEMWSLSRPNTDQASLSYPTTVWPSWPKSTPKWPISNSKYNSTSNQFPTKS